MFVDMMTVLQFLLYSYVASQNKSEIALNIVTPAIYAELTSELLFIKKPRLCFNGGLYICQYKKI